MKKYRYLIAYISIFTIILIVLYSAIYIQTTRPTITERCKDYGILHKLDTIYLKSYNKCVIRESLVEIEKENY